jgi:tRNA-splicing ligase RtcB
MGKQKLTIKELSAIEFPSDVARSLALNIMNRHFKHTPNEEKLQTIKNVLSTPEAFIEHSALGILAIKLVSKTAGEELYDVFELNDAPNTLRSTQ